MKAIGAEKPQQLPRKGRGKLGIGIEQARNQVRPLVIKVARVVPKSLKSGCKLAQGVLLWQLLGPSHQRFSELA